jgi:hypothetical protein
MDRMHVRHFGDGHTLTRMSGESAHGELKFAAAR